MRKKSYKYFSTPLFLCLVNPWRVEEESITKQYIILKKNYIKKRFHESSYSQVHNSIPFLVNSYPGKWLGIMKRDVIYLRYKYSYKMFSLSAWLKCKK